MSIRASGVVTAQNVVEIASSLLTAVNGHQLSFGIVFSDSPSRSFQSLRSATTREHIVNREDLIIERQRIDSSPPFTPLPSCPLAPLPPFSRSPHLTASAGWRDLKLTLGP